MPMNIVTKVGITSLVAGLLGGGIAYGGISYFDNNNPFNQEMTVPTGSNKGGTAQVSNVTVNVQTQAEKAFASVKNSVVSVINMKQSSSSSDPFTSLFGSTGGSSNSNKSSGTLEISSEGSGVIYKKNDGAAYIVTNNHVVDGASALEVILSNGKKMEAKLVGKDAVTDLAVLKINGEPVKSVASFGNSDDIKVGETALAIGSPLGSSYASSLTQGIISAKKREVPQTNASGQSTGTDASVIQTDAAINPGNSGGPLINLAGQVIGINSMKLASDSEGTSVEGMGFAIPSNEVTSIINQLIKEGHVVRPALGVEYVDLANVPVKDQRSILKLPSSVSEGAVVMSVIADSPASAAHLEKYDVITAIDGKKVTDEGKIREELYQHKIGDTISITYYHKGEEKTANIKLTKDSSQIKFSSNTQK